MPLWLASIVRRRWASFGLLVVAMLVIAAAATGPMMLRTVEQSALHGALQSAAPGDTDVSASDSTDPARTLEQTVLSTQRVAEAASASGLFAEAVVTAESSSPVVWRRPGSGGQPSGRSRLVAQEPGCAGFVLAAGSCPRAADQLAMPVTELRSGRLQVGDVVKTGAPAKAYRIVGAYDPARSSALLLPGPLPLAAAQEDVTSADLLVSLQALSGQQLRYGVIARASLLSQAVTVDDESRVRAAVVDAQQVALEQGATATFDSQLPTVLDEVAAQRRAAAGLIAIVTIQVVAAGWLAAIVVMQLVAVSRRRDWALGRLRGLPRRSLLASVVTEPALLVLVGGAVGFAVATFAAHWATDRYLLAGISVEPWRQPVLLTTAVAVLGLFGALVVACVRPARAPLASVLTEGADPVGVSRLALVADALLVAGTAAAVYELVVSGNLSGSGSGLALLAPGLLAAVVGVVVITISAWWARRRTERPARTLAGLLVWRRLARTPSSLLRQVVVAVTVALAVFALQVAALSSRNQSLRADAQVGAATVLQVQVPSGRNVLSAVRAADPGGRTAMAAVEVPDTTGTSRIVAVDTPRLAAVTSWRPSWAGLSMTEVQHRLRPPVTPPIMLRGSHIRLTLAGSTVAVLEGAGGKPPQPDVDAIVSDGTHWSSVGVGVLTGGPAQFGGPLPCPVGCRLVRLVVHNFGDLTPYHAEFTIAALSTDTQPATDFAPVLQRPERWRAVPIASGDSDVSVQATTSGLHVVVEDHIGSSEPAIAPTDVPDPLPVIVGQATQPSPAPGLADAVQGVGLDSQNQLLNVVGTASVVPRALDDGVFADLANISALSDPSKSTAVSEVWLAPGAHPDVERALTARGITLLSRQTLGQARAALRQAAPARAVVVNLVLVGLAAALVLAVFVSTQVLDRRRRQALWRAGRLSRVPRTRMFRMVGAELGAPAVLAVVVGATSGWLALELAGDRLPLFAADTVGPPLVTAPHWPLLLWTVAIALAAVVVLAVASAAVEAARS